MISMLFIQSVVYVLAESRACTGAPLCAVCSGALAGRIKIWKKSADNAAENEMEGCGGNDSTYNTCMPAESNV